MTRYRGWQKGDPIIPPLKNNIVMMHAESTGEIMAIVYWITVLSFCEADSDLIGFLYHVTLSYQSYIISH